MADMEDKHKAIKITVTYMDGHTTDFDTFAAAVATGLIPAGRDERGNCVYMAGKDGFQTAAIVHIYGGSEIMVGLVKTLVRIINNVMPSDLEGLAPFMNALNHIETEVTEEHISVEEKKVDPTTN